MPAAASIDCAHPTVTGIGARRGRCGARPASSASGITLTHTFPITDGVAGTTRNIGLVVCDPGDRYDTAGIPPKAAMSRSQIPT